MATKKKKSVARKIVKAMKNSKRVRTVVTMTVAQVEKVALNLLAREEDSHNAGRFFDYADELRGCCGVLELHGLYSFHLDEGFTEKELRLLARFRLDNILAEHNVKLAVATTANQPREEALLSALGFKAVESAPNPKSRRTITIWTYRRGK